ncbi:MAG TPA: hypothetical protein VMH83_08010 [Candidatus Acidoferrum sp.]|nr:hypothetical protein [Candidatus Acidoferrum sp.]
MVIPFQAGSQNLEHTIATDVVSFCGDHEKHSEEETLEWNEDDIHLFLKLLAARNSGDVRQNPNATTHTFKVDLNDPGTIEIVNIVAAAGFGMTLTVDDLLVADPGDLHEEIREAEVGMPVTLHTVDGYKRGIVVAVEEEEVVCVLLDGIKLGTDRTYLDPLTASVQDYADIHTHDLVVVKPHQLLHARYSSLDPAASDTLH